MTKSGSASNAKTVPVAKPAAGAAVKKVNGPSVSNDVAAGNPSKNGNGASLKSTASKSSESKATTLKSLSPAASSKPAAASSKPAAASATPTAAATKPAATKGAAAPKPGPLDTPIVPKKGPIDLAQHKSVAAAAAAVAHARGGDSGEFIIINGRRVRAISTSSITLPKKTKNSAAEAPPPPTEQQIASIKTKMPKKELDEYRELLRAKRRQLVGMLNGMEDEALRSSGGNLSNMPVHMADMGSDVYEQDFTLGMAETERLILDEIDAALQRIEDKTFGVCQMTGKPISKARLDAKPWAKFTIEAERISEASGGR